METEEDILVKGEIKEMKRRKRERKMKKLAEEDAQKYDMRSFQEKSLNRGLKANHDNNEFPDTPEIKLENNRRNEPMERIENLSRNLYRRREILEILDKF